MNGQRCEHCDEESRKRAYIEMALGLQDIARKNEEETKPMKEYKNLKDLPGAPAGTVFTFCNDGYDYRPKDELIRGCCHLQFSEAYMKNHPEWFAPIEEETLLKAVERVLLAWNVHVGHNDNEHGRSLENLRAAYEREKSK